jgi:hypothetical protein
MAGVWKSRGSWKKVGKGKRMLCFGEGDMKRIAELFRNCVMEKGIFK